MAGPGYEIRIGTSGWYYDHWRGRFYPENLPKSNWLSYYTQKFDTVEINNTFYHLPQEQTLKKWQSAAPADFLFAVKANRYITHIKKLKDTKEELQRFSERIELLKKHLGPVLYQLPPMLHKNLKLLGSFLELLPERHKSIFEFRHESWYSDETFKLLDEFNAGFCIHDLVGKLTPKVITGNVIYIRFHGTSGRYAGNYSKPALSKWAKWIKENCRNVTAVYAYFNNDALGHAVKNARTLKSLVR
ncbi:MAG: DUF72 domain-containing protein [Sedimentisphaerales bacterium]|nr:DUF72 domain-containing protein [Sedimentisphaerales bacterium]